MPRNVLASAIPENLLSLWKAEDDLLPWAAKMILEVPHLSDQIAHVVTYMDCVDLVRQTGLKGERGYGFGSLFIRIFDSFGSALCSSVSGKYRVCAFHLRDILETTFLADYLLAEDLHFQEWNKADQNQIRRKYGPAMIRKYLDTRDGFNEQKRKQHYQMLSALGAHPSPQGIELYKDGGKSVHSGPFKNRDSLQQCIEETGKLSFVSAPVLLKFCDELGECGDQIKSPLSLAQQRITEKYI